MEDDGQIQPTGRTRLTRPGPRRGLAQPCKRQLPLLVGPEKGTRQMPPLCPTRAVDPRHLQLSEGSQVAGDAKDPEEEGTPPHPCLPPHLLRPPPRPARWARRPRNARRTSCRTAPARRRASSAAPRVPSTLPAPPLGPRPPGTALRSTRDGGERRLRRDGAERGSHR